MMNDKERLYDAQGKSFALTHNLRGDTIDKWVKQFTENEQYRKIKRKDSNYLTHEILSWHKDDAKNISLDKMEAMAREYIRLRNPKGMYVAVPHFDKQHFHVHVCSAGLEYRTGKSSWMTKGEFQNLKQQIESFQKEKYPELSKSLVQHSKKEKVKITEKEYQFKLRTGKETLKEKLSEKINLCLAKAGSMDDFIQMLNENGFTPYKRGGRFSGTWFRNRKFRFNRLQINIAKVEELNKGVERQSQIQITRQRNIRKTKGLSK